MATNLASDYHDERGLWRFEFDSMASPCVVLCETEDTDFAGRLAAFARAEATRIDRKFSRYRTDSVIHALHSNRGKPFRVDDETARLLDFGAALWRLSDGRFDLTSGVLREAWRFDEGRCDADPARIPELLDRIGWQRVTWQPPYITLPEGMEIDLGGIGKEYAVDRVADWATSQSEYPVLVNFGGDLRCTGAAPRSGTWMVGIESIEKAGQATRR
ncbi:MAG: FAD:protein FMN transferase, partial [Steroidobacteraceae bacterium]